MTLKEFTNQIVKDGIEAAGRDYSGQKRSGAIAGFSACHNKSPVELQELLIAASDATLDAKKTNTVNYWWYRCYELEVYWVCNCVSCVLINEGVPTIVTPTSRAMLKASQLLGVRS